jgi:hypothetical protein
VPKIFYDNELEALLIAGHDFEKYIWDIDIQDGIEIIHLNKIEELSSDIAADFPDFKAGDLALSMRDLNLVMVVDPGTSQVKWWRIGPWLRQHDPEFKAGGAIVVFNNNLYETSPGITGGSAPRLSNIVEIEVVQDKYKIVCGGESNQQILSVLRGKIELTPGNALLITESLGGRVIEVDAGGDIVWEYINLYNSEEVAQLTEARIYSNSHFDVENWMCPQEPE